MDSRIARCSFSTERLISQTSAMVDWLGSQRPFFELWASASAQRTSLVVGRRPRCLMAQIVAA